LDAQLGKDLEGLNAQVGVISTHTGNPVKARVTDPVTGEEYILHRGSEVRHARAKVRSQQVVNGRKETRFVCADEAQAKELLRELQAEGRELEITDWRREPLYFATPLRFNVAFGGDESFRAAGRVALNFLAHKFPDLARHDGVRPFKEYVLGRTRNLHVFFDYDDRYHADLPMAPLTHRVMVGVNAARSAAFGHVSLFGLVELSVLFGTIPVRSTATFAFDIDPATVSTKKSRVGPRHGWTGVVEYPVATTDVNAYREPDGRIVKENFDRELRRVLGRICDANWARTSDEILPRLLAAAALPSQERNREVQAVLEHQPQRVLNLAMQAARWFEAHQDESECPQLLAAARSLVDGDTQHRFSRTPNRQFRIRSATRLPTLLPE
jgi:hypothetical protein